MSTPVDRASRAPIAVPDLGIPKEDHPVVSCWYARVGDSVYEGDRLVEIHWREVTYDVASPMTGTLDEIVIGRNRRVQAGQILGWIALVSSLTQD